MKIKDLKERGFYKAIDNDNFIIEVLNLSDLTEALDITEEDCEKKKDSLFVDVWYHDPEFPYKHPEGVYQSNGNVYELTTIPEIFENMEFMEDMNYEHEFYGENNMVMKRYKPEIKEKHILN